MVSHANIGDGWQVHRYERLSIAVVFLLACDTGGTYSSRYPGGYGSSGGGGGNVYKTQSTCGFGGNCTIEIEEVGGPDLRRRQAEAALACQLNSDCREGMLCMDGTCSPECKADRDCAEGMLCMPNPSHGWGECTTASARVKLTEAVALRAMKPAIERAQACFADADRQAHTEIRVYITIDGTSGRVEGASLQGSWETKPVGQCVREQMASSVFPPLTQSRVGFWYPLRAGVIPDVPEAVAEPAVTEPAQSETKLTPAQIKAGIEGVRAGIDACFVRSGLGADTQVAVAISVEGSTGFVSQAEVQGDAAGTSLGTCLASQFAQIEFPPFEAGQQSFTYKVRGPSKPAPTE